MEWIVEIDESKSILEAKWIEEIVRCKDCKHGDKENGQYYCHYTGETWNDGNFYCAGGERKDDE